MTALSNPNDIARQTLRMLVTRKQEPTPVNYGRLYCEITGDENTGSAEKVLQRLAAELPHSTPELERLRYSLASAGANHNWEEGYGALIHFIKSQGENVPTQQWTMLVRELTEQLREWPFEKPLAGSLAALEKWLSSNCGIPALHQHLLDLIRAWAKNPVRNVAANTNMTSVEKSAPSNGTGADSITMELRELLARSIEITVNTHLTDSVEISAKANKLTQQLRASTGVDVKALGAQLQTLWLDIELRGDVRDEMQSGLLQLLRLLIENIGELVADDQWMRGQIAVVLQVISGTLSLDAIEEAQRNLKKVILHQSVLRQSLNATKTTLKQMVASFIDELGKLSTATGDYHDSIENLSQKIRLTEDADQLNVLLEAVLQETRSVQASVLHSREEVLRAREHVSVAEIKISQLESQLEQASEKVQHDHLTGTLNRRGLSEAFDREIALAIRQSQPLSIALLDIDNFKSLNDTIGHLGGDGALVHLVHVIKDTMRPSDSVARFGGEEFLILLPNSDAAFANTAVTRLQRELTKRFFLHDDKKLLITFSAGVTTYQDGDTQATAIARADRALYQAKHDGKNRVVIA